MTLDINPLRQGVVFQFIEETTTTRFINSTRSGLLVSAQDGQQAQRPRWGKVVAIGPEVKEVKPADYVLIESGMWTTGFYVDGKRFWKTDESKVLGIGDEPTATY